MKISQFPSGGQAQGLDIVPIVRGGQDYTVTAGTISLLAGTAATTTPSDTAMSNGPPVLAGGQLGTLASPTSNGQPLVSYTKYSSANAGAAEYEGGAGWFSTYRESGTAASVGLTGYVKVDGGTADAVAIHGFGQAGLGTTAKIFSGWFTTHDDNTVLQAQAFGIEVDLQIKVTRSHVTGSIGSNAAIGIWVNNQSDAVGNNLDGTCAIGITGESSGNISRWYTGLFFQTNAIVPGNTNEAIQINGGGVAGSAVCGIRFPAGTWVTTGIDLALISYTAPAIPILLPNNNGIWANDSGATARQIIYLDSSNRVVVSEGTTAGTWLKSNVLIGQTSPPGPNIALITRTTALATATQVGIQSNDTFSSSATGSATGILAANATAAAAFTLNLYTGFRCQDVSLGGGSAITTQIAFDTADLTVGGTNYGIRLQLTSGANKYNIFSSGTALNYLRGALLLNQTTDNGIDQLQITGSALATTSIKANAAMTSALTVAVPASGAVTCGILISSTANLGYYFGSGAPTFSAAQGSVYSNTTGGVGARLYVNTNGATTWAAAASP